MELTADQYKTVSEILGNISVAWFTAGIVSPFFFENTDLTNLVLYLILGISMFIFFGIYSIYYAGKIRKRLI
ncbi:MAG: hypothetical protein UR39_C0001G0053 [Candidatus Woesebacteria bacterium GW2011_GWA1_33_30]|uniref:YrhK domain-containing protein n=1 Tax=Candidatus Woesebacteria bacterium GW2011_GWA2_33_28 TaxID=1618561 RepID=A0A0F9ZV17_9BACT|nr:MAG: hypothetical protein UR38_C0001G0054 [Candidatus Woesebacteria bacterium GW2011_GWA2_33_28]KKP49020.1 MAG: hypothetical protein UR39_C0001G0053 [Candidatus Woesebacteria bacterium GW2011_GWA1_33_30]KKP49872.1 MAG: hypothetical protein UR40_C0003G0044 [Microgenomates group bacterium GW2011_GWC1_33_32]KKP52612.1 MAG: hypothetical protein UR44_C0001G0054 [Candidatus Woesebacteria bacterium GW2011_GWB1_33_38]KKP56678.1 MAG: hypothetical protein UR48_C0032G0011 [Microgenomates group bacteriu